MTSQQHADQSLAVWQQLRNSGLTPEQRMERMLRDVFAPSSDFYEDQLRLVSEEMASCVTDTRQLSA